MRSIESISLTLNTCLRALSTLHPPLADKHSIHRFTSSVLEKTQPKTQNSVRIYYLDVLIFVYIFKT